VLGLLFKVNRKQFLGLIVMSLLNKATPLYEAQTYTYG